MKRFGFGALALLAAGAAAAQGVAPQVTVSQARLGAIDPRDPPYNAACDGATDDHVALLAAATAASNTNAKLIIPNKTCYSSVALSFGKVAVQGAAPIVPTNPPSGPTIKCPASIAAACVTVGTNAGSGLLGASVSDLIVAYTGTPISGDSCLTMQGFNDQFRDTLVYNCYDGYTAVNGISLHALQMYTWNIVHDHFVQNGFPEVYITSARFGMNGAGDQASSNSFVGVTGDNPNGFICTNCQFNLGSVSPKYVFDLVGITNQTDGGYDLHDSIVDISIGGAVSVFHGDGSGTCFRCTWTGVGINAPAVPMFSGTYSGPANESTFGDSGLAVSDFTLPPGQYYATRLHDLNISGTLHLVGVSNSLLSVNGVEAGGAVTVTGNWAGLAINGLQSRTSYSDSAATGVIKVSGVPAQAWAPVLKFGGGNTGLVLNGTAGTFARQPDGTVEAHFAVAIGSSLGSSTGSATITGFPITCSSYSYGVETMRPIYNSSVTVTGSVLAGLNQGTASIGLSQQLTTGLGAVTQANLSAGTPGSYLSGDASCTPQ